MDRFLWVNNLLNCELQCQEFLNRAPVAHPQLFLTYQDRTQLEGWESVIVEGWPEGQRSWLMTILIVDKEHIEFDRSLMSLVS